MNSSLRFAVLVVVFGLAAATAASAQTFQVVDWFGPNFGTYPGTNPNSLIQDSKGNLYGTTESGGGDTYLYGYGTVWGGDFSYAFCPQDKSGVCPEGADPVGVALGTDGNLYGATYSGGANNGGTVFQLTPENVLTTLYSFCSKTNCADGEYPYAGLIQGTDGNFYGTTSYGGANGAGTVFQITSGGQLTTLYSFCSQANCTDGKVPESVLLQGSDGNFYGTTAYGGANVSACGGYGCGTVFQVTSTGALTTLYSFCSLTNCADGSNPRGQLIQGIGGNLYGTASRGGNTGAGTVFQLTPAGTLATLYSFCSLTKCTDGSDPSSLILGIDGNFYGTTTSGGDEDNDGTFFRLVSSGTFSTLYDFSNSYHQGGLEPTAIVQNSSGAFYGVTFYGGSFGGCHHYGCGVLFGLSLSVALPPTFTPTSLSFPEEKVGKTSKPKPVTISNPNTGIATLDLALSVSGPFAISKTTCKGTLAVGKTCKVSVEFKPTAIGSAIGTLNVSDNAPGSPQTVSLSGSGD